MAVEEGLDTGAVYRRVELEIGPDETADELRSRLVEAGTRLVLGGLQSGLTDPEPQQGEVTYAEKIQPSELELDWSRSAELVHRVVRVGGAWTIFRGRRLKVWRTVVAPDATGDEATSSPGPGEIDGLRVGTGDGVVELLEVQPEGKGRQAAAAWRNGAQPRPDERMGE
jgi:methionyl-tRNA formyltransferase